MIIKKPTYPNRWPKEGPHWPPAKKKKKRKETAPSNYRPTTCLPMTLKIVTAQIREEIYFSLILFTNPSARAGYDTRSIFKLHLTGLNSEFSFSKTSYFTTAKEPSLPYYLPIAGGRIIGFIPFPRVLVLCEMQSVSFRIWNRAAVSISCDDYHYTTGTSKKFISHL